jgi:hypothetical protein
MVRSYDSLSGSNPSPIATLIVIGSFSRAESFTSCVNPRIPMVFSFFPVWMFLRNGWRFRAVRGVRRVMWTSGVASPFGGMSPSLAKREMARLRGVEPPTSGSGDQRSIQLSYRRAVCVPHGCALHHAVGAARDAQSASRTLLQDAQRIATPDDFTSLHSP